MIPSHVTTAQKLTRARVQLLLSYPFFGTLCLRLKLIPGNLPTLATDGSRIVYNPTFVVELKPAELEGTLAHEVLHCALGHQSRRGERVGVRFIDTHPRHVANEFRRRADDDKWSERHGLVYGCVAVH